jgi:hypothetical protein
MTQTVSMPEFAVFLLQWVVVVFSMFAGLFWLKAASTVRRAEIFHWPPWRKPKFVPPTFTPRRSEATRNPAAGTDSMVPRVVRGSVAGFFPKIGAQSQRRT